MTVITLTSVPNSLRGDLTLWMQEVNTGTFVGNVSARVRDRLWERITKYAGDGRATMVYNARNEQGMAIRTYNSPWMLDDCDGLQIVKKPFPQAKKHSEADTKERKRSESTRSYISYSNYVVIDIETTGLKADTDDIIEIGAILVTENEIKEEMECLVKVEREIPQAIEDMTGITSEMIKDGIPIREALERFGEFAGLFPLVGHNVKFDMSFINQACIKNHMQPMGNITVDTFELARRMVHDVPNYKLQTLLDRYGIERQTRHRALPDCRAIQALYSKLNEIREIGSEKS